MVLSLPTSTASAAALHREVGNHNNNNNNKGTGIARGLMGSCGSTAATYLLNSTISSTTEFRCCHSATNSAMASCGDDAGKYHKGDRLSEANATEGTGNKLKTEIAAETPTQRVKACDCWCSLTAAPTIAMAVWTANGFAFLPMRAMAKCKGA